MRIGLMGFTFTHENKGCEALTYSMLGLISKICKDKYVEIVNFSGNPDLGMVPDYFPNFVFMTQDLHFGDPKLQFLKNLNKCDFVFDVTFGDGFSDIYFVKSVYRNAVIKFVAGMAGTTYIMAPQTYGPFKRKTLEWLAGRAIHNADCVYARDQISADYAKKISNRDVRVVTDLAFGLPFEQNSGSNKLNAFGLNISGLLWRGGFSSDNQFNLTVDYKSYCSDLVEYLLKHTDYQVHLIPHVTLESTTGREGVDSDIYACNQVKEMYANEDRVIVAPAFNNPIQAKNYISHMKIFLGARMHSTIAAFSTGVTTIPFAYSRKFQGLYYNVDYEYVLNACKDNNTEILNKTIYFINNEADLKQAQSYAMKNIEKKFDMFEAEMEKLLKK